MRKQYYSNIMIKSILIRQTELWLVCINYLYKCFRNLK